MMPCQIAAMRWMAAYTALLLWVGCPSAGARAAAVTPLGPEDVSVEFFVRGTGSNEEGFIELYSRPAWDDEGCFFIRVPTSARPAFLSAGIAGIEKHFLGWRVRVTGRVRVLQFGNRCIPCVVVGDPARIVRIECARNFTPSAAYEPKVLRGFEIRVAPELMRRERERVQVFGELDRQLNAICQVVDPVRLAILKSSKIWVEWEARAGGAAEHHPSEAWLKHNGYNPEKAGDVEISNARNFVAWSRGTQPWMLMHELAHAYHHRTRAENDRRIEEAYRKALDEGIYATVRHADGRSIAAYAAKNKMEYFAELTEAYFGRNDFQPFDRGELKGFDPGGYALMESVWGKPLKQPVSPGSSRPSGE